MWLSYWDVCTSAAVLPVSGHGRYVGTRRVVVTNKNILLIYS